MSIMMMLLVSILLWCASMADDSEMVSFTSEEGGTFLRQAQHKQQAAGIITAMEAGPSSSEGARKRKLQGQTNLRLTKNENGGDNETSSRNLQQKFVWIKQNEADIEVLTTALATANVEELVATNTAVATANTNIATLIKDLTASNTALATANASIEVLTTALATANGEELVVARNTDVATTNTNIVTLTKDLSASNTALAAAKARIDANNEALVTANALNAKLYAAVTTALTSSSKTMTFSRLLLKSVSN
jgi:hypothetical protein